MKTKDVRFVVLPSGDENEIQTAFNTYFIQRDFKSLLNLAIRTLSRALYGSEIWSIEFMVTKDLLGVGEYDDGRIKISKQLFDAPHKISTMPLVLSTVFHELTHAVIHVRNRDIVINKKKPDAFLPVYDNGRMYEIFQSVSKDMEYSAAATRYYYQQNQNEFKARYVANKLLKEYLSAYASGYDFKLQPFEIEEQNFQNGVYNAFPLFRDNESHASGMITKYQCGVIEKGLEKATENEIKNMIASISVQIDRVTRQKLIQACADCHNFDITNKLLATPQIRLDSHDIEVLSRSYDLIDIESKFFCANNVKKDNQRY